MPILPISSMDASRDPLSASILYAYTCYPKDQKKREEVVATFLAEACIGKPEAQPILDHAATNFSWFLPALHRASRPDRVLRDAAEQTASAWPIGEMLLIMLGAAMHHPELEVTPTKTVWVMSEFHKGGKSRTGATVNASVRYLWKTWTKFRPVAHFHAVRPVWNDEYDDTNPDGFPKFQFNAFGDYLAIAESIRQQAVIRRFLSQEETWRPPESLPLTQIEFTPGALKPEMVALFQAYRPEHSRH